RTDNGYAVWAAGKAARAHRIYVGANDGMLHVFNAATGAEVFAYIPSEVIPKLHNLKSPAYYDGHRYYVNGEIVVDDIVFSDNSVHKVLIGGLGAGGQAYYALDISNTVVASDANLKGKLLWEISDDSTGMANLGYSYSRPLLVKVKTATSFQWAVIFGNGYSNTSSDDTAGSGTASLFVVNAQTGVLIREINTGSGSTISPNGLSSPTAVDTNRDGIVDYVYAGDLDGHVWRFDFSSTDKDDWAVSFSDTTITPFASLIDSDSDSQPITTPPKVLRHTDGGLLILIGTGRMLSSTDPANDQVQSVYGLRDRLDGSPLTLSTDSVTGNIVVQYLNDGTYVSGETSFTVRTSSNEPVPHTMAGWVVDLSGGERVLAPLQIRSNNVIFSSIDPTQSGKIWVNEFNFLTGGAPDHIIYDMNEDGAFNVDDNTDGNDGTDGNDVYDMTDPRTRVTGLMQGTGLVVSTPTLAVLDGDSGTFFVNRVQHSVAEFDYFSSGDTGLSGGHFDVDTTDDISPIGNGHTDAHEHEYDDKYDVKGVDYFAFHSNSLNEITDDISNSQKFKLIIVNADKSPGGRLVINQYYISDNVGTYSIVTQYDNTPVSDLPVYTLEGTEGTTQLINLGMYFDVNAFVNKKLIPTQTGCVQDNIRSTDGEWRNGALTIWAVEVDADGSDAFTLETDADTGNVTGITDGLLWESTLFWHWDGPCAHEDEYGRLEDTYLDHDESVLNPATGESYTIFEYYRDKTLDVVSDPPQEGDSDVGRIIRIPGAVANSVVEPSTAQPSSLFKPGQVSWSEL
ncbi:MAG: hypothetical protein DRQ58_09720, partial [Gammaproteobacteria bacterium]